jgi:ribosomal protein S4
MLLKPKYKFLIKLRQNIWNTSKPLKFKKLKWKKVKRILFINSYKERRQFSKKKYFFLKDFRMRYFFNLMLNTKKILFNTFGPLKRKQISKIMKKSIGKGIGKKSYSLGFNRVTANNVQYDDYLYLMRSLESKLLTTLSRSGIFSNIFVYLHFIKCGYVLVNGQIIRNPFFNLKEGDTISLSLDLSSILGKFQDLKFKTRKTKNILNQQYKKYLKFNFKKKNKFSNCKSKHLIKIIGDNYFKIIFVKKPDFSDVEYVGMFHWDIFHYILKLKR